MKVVTDAKVIEVRQQNGHISSVVTEAADGTRTEWNADQFISSMPVKDLVEAIDAAGVDTEAAATGSKAAPEAVTEVAEGPAVPRFRDRRPAGQPSQA